MRHLLPGGAGPRGQGDIRQEDEGDSPACTYTSLSVLDLDLIGFGWVFIITLPMLEGKINWIRKRTLFGVFKR